MEQKEIKILHLYHDLMNLYGDWANVAVMERELIAQGFEVIIDKKSVGDDIGIEDYDFLCIGSGTERSQLACMRDLVQYKDALFARLDAGVPVLATGNSHELFGLAVTDPNNTRYEMLGLLDFETIQLNTRITGDCVCKASFLEEKLIGFINRAGGSQKGEIERPFFIEPQEGASYAACAEGIRYNNLIGTYLTGPVLVRNPHLLKWFADIVVKQKNSPSDFSRATGGSRPYIDFTDSQNRLFFEYQEIAYRTTLNEMEQN